MNSACAEPRLRCRVKDLVASCFNTCRLPLEEEEEAKPQPETPSKGVANSDVRGNEASIKTTPDSRKRSVHSRGGGRRVAEAEPRFAEEDYIVFCFGEDGEIHMINSDRDSSEIQPCSCSSSTNSGKIKNEAEQPNASKMESSFESCDSSLSDTSTTSFAFPVLGIEWIGSPLHMPNAEKPDGDANANANGNGAHACRHCCRF